MTATSSTQHFTSPDLISTVTEAALAEVANDADLSQAELIEIMIQLAPYTGVPAAINGVRLLMQALEARESQLGTPG